MSSLAEGAGSLVDPAEDGVAKDVDPDPRAALDAIGEGEGRTGDVGDDREADIFELDAVAQLMVAPGSEDVRRLEGKLPVVTPGARLVPADPTREARQLAHPR